MALWLQVLIPLSPFFVMVWRLVDITADMFRQQQPAKLQSAVYLRNFFVDTVGG